jgi:hypothetical protein
MEKFAVIDTETNWSDQVMSIGLIIADGNTFNAVDKRYYILPKECQVGGMYSGTLYMETPVSPLLCSRSEAISDLLRLFHLHGVRSIFAYNACFDRNHLRELSGFQWYDIMNLAAYRQYNHKIPPNADCCATGRLKRGYGVEPMLRLLSGKCTYCESHNAFHDAMDELEIMKLMKYAPEEYIRL